MKKSLAVLVCAFMLLAARSAKADRIHLPCDPDTAVSIGTGAFLGHSGAVGFERVQPLYLRLELTPPRFRTKCLKGRPSRRWFGRLNLYGSITLEDSNLSFEHAPDIKRDADGNVVYQTDVNGDPILDADGQKIPRTEDTLTKVDLNAGRDWSGGLGARFSLYDGDHFHLEGFGEFTGSFGSNPARINVATVHVLELDLDETDTARRYAKLTYRWSMKHLGLTAGFPFRPRLLGRARLTPFVILGYMWFRADIDITLDQSFRDDLTRYGADPDKIAAPRTIDKESPTMSLGARLDFGRHASLEASSMFGFTRHTTAYFLSASFIIRFGN